MIEMMVGRRLTDQFPRVEITPGKTILKVENLNNEYVSNINFEVRAGEVVGIAGLMGAGRSELAKTIYGHFKKESGKIILNGKELNHKSAQEGLLHRIAYVSEDRKGDGLLVDLSVRENMTLSSLNRISKGLIIDKKHENEILMFLHAKEKLENLGINTNVSIDKLKEKIIEQKEEISLLGNEFKNIEKRLESIRKANSKIENIIQEKIDLTKEKEKER